jgi:hypothetical protein
VIAKAIPSGAGIEMKRVADSLRTIYPFFVAIVAPFALAFPVTKFNLWLVGHVEFQGIAIVGYVNLFLALVPGIVCLLRIPGWSLRARLGCLLLYVLLATPMIVFLATLMFASGDSF